MVSWRKQEEFMSGRPRESRESYAFRVRAPVGQRSTQAGPAALFTASPAGGRSGVTTMSLPRPAIFIPADVDTTAAEHAAVAVARCGWAVSMMLIACFLWSRRQWYSPFIFSENFSSPNPPVFSARASAANDFLRSPPKRGATSWLWATTRTTSSNPCFSISVMLGKSAPCSPSCPCSAVK